MAAAAFIPMCEADSPILSTLLSKILITFFLFQTHDKTSDKKINILSDQNFNGVLN